MTDLLQVTDLAVTFTTADSPGSFMKTSAGSVCRLRTVSAAGSPNGTP